MPTSHALLSASSAHRWLNCPPSAKLTEDLPDTTSEMAAEGTLAHALAEAKLRAHLTGTPLTVDLGEPIPVDMDEYTDEYVSHCLNLADANPGHTVFIEQRLDFSPWVPEGFGTGDFVLVGNGEAHIVDLKYGKGVKVEAEENPQLRLYGLGVLNTFGDLYQIDRVTVTIVQPRLNHIVSESLPVATLLAWGQTVTEVASLAWEGGGDLHAGEWCRFCKLKTRCVERAVVMLSQVRDRHKPVLTEKETAQILTVAPDVKQWLSALEEDALTRALAGETIPGFKVVEGRSVRSYTSSETEIVKAAKAGGYKPSQLYAKKLLTITAMEKLMGRSRFQELLGSHVNKTPGKPALAPNTDPRPDITQKPETIFTPLEVEAHQSDTRIKENQS